MAVVTADSFGRTLSLSPGFCDFPQPNLIQVRRGVEGKLMWNRDM